MKKFRFALATTALAAFAMANVVRADATNVRSITSVEGTPLSLTSLQAALDARTTNSVFIDTSAQSTAALFSNSASGTSIATFVIELAGFAGTNTFGMYDSDGDKVELFDGSATSGSSLSVSFTSTGDVFLNNVTLTGTPDATDFNRNGFGFYIDVFGAGADSAFDYTVYTEDSKNTAVASGADPDGHAGALVYQGDGTTKLDPDLGGPRPEGFFTANEFIFAFEDLLPGETGFGRYDADFDDLVVLVESIKPVPAPAALLLGAMGLGMVGWVRKRVK